MNPANFVLTIPAAIGQLQSTTDMLCHFRLSNFGPNAGYCGLCCWVFWSGLHVNPTLAERHRCVASLSYCMFRCECFPIWGLSLLCHKFGLARGNFLYKCRLVCVKVSAGCNLKCNGLIVWQTKPSFYVSSTSVPL